MQLRGSHILGIPLLPPFIINRFTAQQAQQAVTDHTSSTY
jgi:hypothetical protein